ncbi:MAG: hypothetical protein P1P74_06935 [Desulfuromonadales bacterium]|nr:hypothetical protein [Desulfuromonadales bacterium]
MISASALINDSNLAHRLSRVAGVSPRSFRRFMRHADSRGLDRK